MQTELGIAAQEAQDQEEFRLSDGDGHRRLDWQFSAKAGELYIPYRIRSGIVKVARQLSPLISRGQILCQGTASAVPHSPRRLWPLDPAISVQGLKPNLFLNACGTTEVVP